MALSSSGAGGGNRNNIDLKIILLGQSGVGKTSLIHRYVHQEFSMTMSTIGAAFLVKSWSASAAAFGSGRSTGSGGAGGAKSLADKTFMLGIWDTAGQEKYASLSGFYCRGAGAAILVYDMTNRSSFEDLKQYHELLMSSEDNFATYKGVKFLVASKLDLVREGVCERQVEHLEGTELAAQWGPNCFYTETSSKSDFNVTELFDSVARKCLLVPLMKRGGGVSGGSVRLGGDEESSSSSGCC
eukprot:Nk52_evm41s266 gene=Nk52_evmTU41s266